MCIIGINQHIQSTQMNTRSKYTNHQILEVIRLYTTTGMTHTEISDVSGVGLSTVQDIIHRRSHTSMTKDIDLKAHERKHVYRIYSPQGVQYEANTIEELSKACGLQLSTVYSILNSKSGIGKNGWTAYKQVQYVVLTSPEGDTIELNTSAARIVLQEAGLKTYSINRLLKSYKPASGWRSRPVLP